MIDIPCTTTLSTPPLFRQAKKKKNKYKYKYKKNKKNKAPPKLVNFTHTKVGQNK
jgi:hypothetical protein